MKTTIRCTVTLPDNTAYIQRLYDHGTIFTLASETITDTAKLADFLEFLTERGAQLIDNHDFVDCDDLQPKHSYTFELTM